MLKLCQIPSSVGSVHDCLAQSVDAGNNVNELKSQMLLAKIEVDCSSKQQDLYGDENLLSTIDRDQQLCDDANIVTSEDSSSDDGNITDDVSSSEADTSGVLISSTNSVTKRVTWSGLDELDYVPTRTVSRKRVRRKKSSRSRVGNLSKPSISPRYSTSSTSSSRKTGSDNSPAKSKKKVLTEETAVLNGEQVVIVRMRTGCLYMYKGPNARVVFKRS